VLQHHLPRRSHTPRQHSTWGMATFRRSTKVSGTVPADEIQTTIDPLISLRCQTSPGMSCAVTLATPENSEKQFKVRRTIRPRTTSRREAYLGDAPPVLLHPLGRHSPTKALSSLPLAQWPPTTRRNRSGLSVPDRGPVLAAVGAVVPDHASEPDQCIVRDLYSTPLYPGP
jgi:hypothetical protein